MPCTKCGSDFNLLNWKIKCGECEDKYCNKCLKRREGILYCEKCHILLKRPPDRLKLMELKSKDLQDYLNKRNISTYGLVEKHELVDLLCNKQVPDKPKKGMEKLTANFAVSLPNLRPLNELWDSVITNDSTSNATGQARASRNESRNNARSPPAPSTPQSPQNPPRTATPAHSPQPTTSTNTHDRPKGCVEKAERLWEDSNELRKEEPEKLPVQELCKLCMDAPLDCVLLECGHIATCIACGKKLAECPICRQYVVRVVRTFKA
ncbi:unnamed protein product [Phyllotreta striolata]|uniref:RING-type domain-containing protein n=1 Tax=Phyllotreta striolata TaxID=444603 RepID=A0A9N9TP25_PHYSR|nr:unnamed protein product [Phyllotreta striolata]